METYLKHRKTHSQGGHCHHHPVATHDVVSLMALPGVVGSLCLGPASTGHVDGGVANDCTIHRLQSGVE